MNVNCFILFFQGVDSDAMGILLQSVYKKEEVNLLKSNNILSVLQASSMLQFESVQKSCVDLIVHEWLNISTCLQTMITAHELDLITLYHKAQAVALWEFSQVKSTDAFLHLSIDHVIDYLGNDALNTTEGEFEVFEAAVNWIQFKPLQRINDIQQIFACVRFCDISVSDIKTIFLYPLISENVGCQQILNYILCIKEGKDVSTDFEEESPSNSIETGSQNSDDVFETRQKRIKTCICINRETREETNSIINKCCGCCTGQDPPTPDDEVQYHNDITTKNKFSTEIISIGTELLSKSSRMIPLVPCVLGHKVNRLNLRRNTEEIRKSILYSGKPYIIYFQEGKTRFPVPFLHISKASEGPMEPTGYKVICRGKCY